MHTCDARPETAEEAGFEQVGVCAVGVEGRRGGCAGGGDEVEAAEGGEEVVPEGGDVANCRG